MTKLNGSVLLYLIPIATGLGSWLGGPWIWLPAVLVFLFIPIFDELLTVNTEAALDTAIEKPTDWILFAFLPVSAIVLAWQAHFFYASETALIDRIGLVLGAGLCAGGLGITIAHELIHRPSKNQQWVGRVLLAMVSYGHYSVEHVFGHHRHVGTPLDPVSAREGQSFYAYFPRAVFGSIVSGWRIEKERLARSGVGVWSRGNRVLENNLITMGIVALFAGVWGWPGVVFFFAQSIVAFTLLEVIDYVEHYGLRRKEVRPGEFEPVRAWHSWDSNKRVSNWLLINLQRHADHHLKASKPYHELRSLPESPMLPCGYPTMALLAMVPPLWFAVMHPRLAAVRRQESKVKKAQAVLARASFIEFRCLLVLQVALADGVFGNDVAIAL